MNWVNKPTGKMHFSLYVHFRVMINLTNVEKNLYSSTPLMSDRMLKDLIMEWDCSNCATNLAFFNHQNTYQPNKHVGSIIITCSNMVTSLCAWQSRDTSWENTVNHWNPGTCSFIASMHYKYKKPIIIASFLFETALTEIGR